MKKALLSVAALAARSFPASWRRAVYRPPWLAKLIRKTLNQAAPTGLVETRIAAGTLAGMGMYLDLHREKDYWLGTYELDLQAALLKYIEPGMTVYDVGANIGYISLLLARLIGEQGKVFSFEALPANQVRLNNNVALNNLNDRITCIEGAVTNSNAPQRFLVHASTSMGKTIESSGRHDEIYQDEIDVPGITLDDFVFQQKHPEPQLIKIDIEGGEGLAIAGMQKLLKQVHPIMLIELHGHEAAKSVFEQLTVYGYRIFRMEPGYPQVTSIEQFDWKSYIIGCKN